MHNEITFTPIINSIRDISASNHKVHIGIKQRTTRSSITLVENLPNSFDLTILLKKMRKNFHCSGSIQSGQDGKIIQLSGDQRVFVKKFLINNSLIDEENVITHGY